MTKHRVETPDTLDEIIRLAAHLQSEGWGLEHLDYSVEYDTKAKSDKRTPIGIILTAVLVPPR